MTAPALSAPTATKAIATPARERSHLHLVATSSRRRGIAGHMTIAVVMIMLALVTQLLLNIATAHGAYRVDELQDEQVALQREVTALEENVRTLQSPQHLTEQATGMGMEPAQSHRVINESTGQDTVVGGRVITKTDPRLVGNEALHPSAPNIANPNVSGDSRSGVAPDQELPPVVPSGTELSSPATR